MAPSTNNLGPRVARAGGFLCRNVKHIGIRVYNGTGSDIAADKLVALLGFDTTSKLPKIVLADADVSTHTDVYVTVDTITNATEGNVYKGAVSAANLNTNSASAAGDPVYLDTTAGGFAHTAPSGTDDKVLPVGWVLVKSATVGQIHWNIGEHTKYASFVDGIDFNGLSPAASPILFTGITLAANSNLIRGTGITPTRVSGYTAFTGTVTNTLAAVYTDYRELHSAGTDEVLGIGSFPYMDSGATCKSLWGGQFISFVSAGATVSSAAAAPLTGIYSFVGKAVIDGATVASGAQIGAIALSVQANVTDISGEASCIAYMEVASGTLRDIFYLNATASNLATNLFNFSAAVSPLTTGGGGTPTAASGTWYNLRCSINGTPAYIPISTAAWTNA